MERSEASSREGTGSVLVVGATSGIGFEVAEGIARAGVPVIGVGRNRDRCVQAAERISAATGGPPVLFELADLSVQREVRSLAARLIRDRKRLRAIVYNAGTFTLGRQLTEDGVERQFAVNYLSGFMLTALLLPLLVEGSRVVLISSGSHQSGRIHWGNLALRPLYNGLTAYAQSKLAEILFARELARRVPSLDSYAVDPGLVRTEIGLKEAGAFGRLVWRLRARAGISPQEAAAPIVEMVLSNGFSGRSGLYWKEGIPLSSSPRSYDTAAAERLWELSERLCGISFSEVIDATA